MTTQGAGKARIVVGRAGWARAGLLVAAVVALHVALLLWLQQGAVPGRPLRDAALVLRPMRAQAHAQLHEQRADVVPPAAATRPRAVPGASKPRAVAPAVGRAPMPKTTEGLGDPPLYPTRLPGALHWRYRFDRTGVPGSVELRWRPDGARYQAQMRADAQGRLVFDWSSRGALAAHGMEPERFDDQRQARGRHSAEFERQARRIRYSGTPAEAVLAAGSQDRLSWLLQLAGVVAAEPARWQPGEPLELFVSGARGDAALWSFRVEGWETLAELPNGPVRALKLLREPPRPYDIRAEVWLDPARQHMPVKAVFRNGATTWTWTLAEELAP